MDETKSHFQMSENEIISKTEENQAKESDKKTTYDIRPRMISLLSAILAFVTFVSSYLIAHSLYGWIKSFPFVYITHLGINFPNYIIYRIGMMVAAGLFFMNYCTLKQFFSQVRAFLVAKSQEIKGQQEKRMKYFVPLALIGCVSFCFSTSTMSDGKQMDWLLHRWVSEPFFFICAYLLVRSSMIYTELYQLDNSLCSWWSYMVKKYNWAVALFCVFTLFIDFLQILEYQVGCIGEWVAVSYFILFFATGFYDFKEISLEMEEIDGEVNIKLDHD